MPVSTEALISVGSIESVAAATDLAREHYDEVCTNKQLMQLDPDWDAYRDLERAGRLLTLLVFVDGKLVGYSVNLLMPKHLHYRGLRYVVNDLLFVSAEHRRGGVGKKLIQRTNELAKLEGYQAVTWHAKEGTALETVLRRMGLRVQDVILIKEF